MDRGEIVWCDFDPSAGTEIQKTRPAVVISRELFTRKFGLVVLVPITNTSRNWPTIVKLPNDLKTTGYIVAHQVKTLDVHARRVRESGEKLNQQTLESVMEIVEAVVIQ